MEWLKKTWKRVPNKPRRVLTFIVGALLILTSALIGWIPGPGGMIPFLLGIAVLATEFAWAERLRDRILAWLKIAVDYYKSHRRFAGLVTLLGLTTLLVGIYFAYSLI